MESCQEESKQIKMKMIGCSPLFRECQLWRNKFFHTSLLVNKVFSVWLHLSLLHLELIGKKYIYPKVTAAKLIDSRKASCM